MELNKYQERAMTTCTESSHNFAYMFMNLVGEVGEFASKCAKHIRKGHAEIGLNQFDFVGDITLGEVNDAYDELEKEAGDILWQLSCLCTVMGWRLEDIAQKNLTKLADRQQRNVIVGEGDNR